jgi:Domain of unknown function (DUF4878)
MPARPLSPLLLALLTLGLAACGTTTSTSNFKGEAHAVAQAIADLQSNATALEHKKVCHEDLASSVVTRLNRAPGGCEKALESQLKQIDSFEVTVESVKIDGASASAHVKSIREGKNHIETLTLVKQGGKWRVSGVD